MKKRTKFILEIVVVVALLGYVVYALTNTKKFKITGVSDFRQSEMNLEGLNQYASENINPNWLVFPIEPISPDWKWVAYQNKDSYIEFASIQNPSKILFDPSPQKNYNLIGWSPDGQAFLASANDEPNQDMAGWFSNIIIIFKIESDKTIKKIEFEISSALPYGEPFVRNVRKHVTWSPDGKFLAVITNSDKHILIIDNEGNYVQTLPIRNDKRNPNSNVDTLIWTTSGLTFSYADSTYSQYYRWITVTLDKPLQQVEVYSSKDLTRSTVLGSYGASILTWTSTSQDEFELLLINTDTQQIENVYNVAARKIVNASLDSQNKPYTVFTSQNIGYKDILWVFDWTTLKLKQYPIENYFAVTGWSPALDGIGVLTEKNRKFDLWVVKP